MGALNEEFRFPSCSERLRPVSKGDLPSYGNDKDRTPCRLSWRRSHSSMRGRGKYSTTRLETLGKAMWREPGGRDVGLYLRVFTLLPRKSDSGKLSRVNFYLENS